MKLSSSNNKIWFTSDLHFGHKRIIEFCPKTRPYSSVDEMNDDIINKWNSSVGEGDTVFILGDVSFAKEDETNEYLSQLNGRKILITGNHDKGLNKRYFDQTNQSYVEAKIDGVDVIMCHYPIYEWNKMHYGSYHLYGHVHGKPVPFSGRHMDVGLDVNGCLFNWEEVHTKLQVQPIRQHGG